MEETTGSNKKHILIVVAIFVIIAAFIIFRNKEEKKEEESSKYTGENKNAFTKSEIELREKMRKLWSDHVFWTRQYVIDYFNGSKETPVTGKRLMQNQEEIGAALAPYYGEVNGKKITSLLKDHISIASKILVDLRKKDKKSLTKNNAIWYKNADDIAESLHSLNKEWDASALKKDLYAHLDDTKEMVTNGLDKKWQDEIHAFDKNYAHMLKFSDELSEGITEQFPEKVLNS